MAIPGLDSAIAPLEAVAGAAGALTGAFTGLIGQITQLVGAVAPGVVEMMFTSFRELQATLGQALIPIATVLSGLFRDIAASLDPVLKSLVPIIAKLASIMGSQIAAVAEAVAMILDSLIPVIEILVEAFRPISDLVQVVAIALGTLFQAMKPLFELFSKAIIEPFVNILKEATKALILFTAALMKLFGVSLEGLIANLTKDKNPATANLAPTQGGIKTLDQISKDITTGAFAAGQGSSQVSKEDQFMKDVVQGLNDINEGKKGLKEIIKDGVRAALGLPSEAEAAHNGDSGFWGSASKAYGKAVADYSIPGRIYRAITGNQHVFE